MAALPTLNSRIRVLVAKAFRAEKLYSSLALGGLNSTGSAIADRDADRSASSNVLAQIANEVRAKEWKRSHYQLRTSLNDLLAEGSGAQLAPALIELRDGFLRAAQESRRVLAASSETLAENARRQEYAHIFKLSVELIRHKARAQANQVVADELTALLDASRRSTEPQAARGAHSSVAVARAAAGASGDAAAAEPTGHLSAGFTRPSNVIPLKRRIAGGRRGS